MPDTLFNSDDNPGQQQTDQSTDNQGAPAAITIPAEVADLIGEGKKYKTIEDALASIPAAQDHITKIEGENSEMRGKLESNDKLDQILNKLDPQQNTQQQTQPQVLNVGDIVKAVKQDLQQEATVAQKTSNRALVEAKLTEKYGEKASEEFVKKAAELQMTPEDLTELSATSPNAALQLMGVTEATAPKPKMTTDRQDVTDPIGDPPKPKSVMFGASSKEILDAWRAGAPQQ